jgi:glycosyltransferase involved in cell wall biosynthesis
MAVIYVLALDATRKGGAGVYTLELLRTLALHGHSVTLLCHEAAEEIKGIVRVIELPKVNSARSFGLWRFSSWLQILDYIRMFKQIELLKPDVVIGSAQPMTLAFLNINPTYPLIYIPHSLVAPLEISSYPYGSSIQRYASIKAYRFMEKKCLGLARFTLRFSQSACHKFIEYYGRNKCGRLVALTMPIHFPKKVSGSRDSGTVHLLFVGRLIPSKNVQFLLDLLLNMPVRNWKLDIVGDGGERKSLVEYVKANDLGDRVAFHGHVDDVAHFYMAADLFVFPSLLESYGIVLLEAMSYSLPTLSFRSDNKRYFGVSSEFIENGKTGFLAKDEEDFAEILKDALTGKAELKACGDAAWFSLQDKYNWDNHVTKIEKIIRLIDEKDENQLDCSSI